jgi:hypothetical protein
MFQIRLDLTRIHSQHVNVIAKSIDLFQRRGVLCVRFGDFIDFDFVRVEILREVVLFDGKGRDFCDLGFVTIGYSGVMFDFSFDFVDLRGVRGAR